MFPPEFDFDRVNYINQSIQKYGGVITKSIFLLARLSQYTFVSLTDNDKINDERNVGGMFPKEGEKVGMKTDVNIYAKSQIEGNETVREDLKKSNGWIHYHSKMDSDDIYPDTSMDEFMGVTVLMEDEYFQEFWTTLQRVKDIGTFKVSLVDESELESGDPLLERDKHHLIDTYKFNFIVKDNKDEKKD
jgi:hypothetical protein